MVWTGSAHIHRHRAQHNARRIRILKRDSYTCQIQGPRCTHTATVLDHILAIRLGGTDTDSNTQAACRNCNQWKAAHEGVQARRRNTHHPKQKHPGLR